ncbi:MAG: S8 family peptidase [Ardenticatenaceae bacterium]|nr:S8 family peptidase [Ardenticatenaceae bacterium]
MGSRPQTNPFAPDLSPNDPQFANQWHYKYVAGSSEGLNLIPAWDIYTGSASTVVAVIDTGILPHSDLAGKTVPGYDFIADVATANDGNGRDADPSDPGDWIAASECFPGNQASNSSWHGTHVAGTIGAATNNGAGVAGVNWNAKILPIRVLGKCGGYTSDIIDGMRWAAGLTVTGVTNNPNPAKVLNLSLGGSGPCSSTEQTAINAIVAAGSTVVIAAGNNNDDASGYSPGNCNNIITVAANDRSGDRAYYSNYGSIVEVTGPGGAQSFANDSNGVLSTLDGGATTPLNDNAYKYYQGTSMATPHVAGVASLIVGMKPGYTQAQVLALLQNTARSFPAGSTCNTSICGAGIVDAYQALNMLNVNLNNFAYLPVVVKPAAAPPPPTTIVNPGFESGATGWTEFSTHGWDVIVNSFTGSVTAHGGTWAAWLGGDYDDISYVQQQVTVPASTPYLAYWHWIASEDTCGFDYGGVLVNGTVADSYELCSSKNTGGWVHHVVNLGAYAGQTVTLQIRAETDVSLNSNLFVDDVTFQATPTSLSSSARVEDLTGTTAVRQ